MLKLTFNDRQPRYTKDLHLLDTALTPEAMRSITNMLTAMLMGSVFYAMSSALGLPNINTPSTLEIKEFVEPSYNTISHLEVRDVCPTDSHGDKVCGTCVTLFEGSFYLGKSHNSCTPAFKCVTAPSFGFDEFRSIGFSGSTRCVFSRRLDCLSNDLGEDVIAGSVLMQDLQDSSQQKGFRSVECSNPN